MQRNISRGLQAILLCSVVLDFRASDVCGMVGGVSLRISWQLDVSEVCCFVGFGFASMTFWEWLSCHARAVKGSPFISVTYVSTASVQRSVGSLLWGLYGFSTDAELGFRQALPGFVHLDRQVVSACYYC